ncbi:MAG: type II toxin-antitoxin system PemK/MazF family toxin [Candidatus Nomurabacteria bacterium]|jgi:mRNA interferase MazF|nr:type II toxin-antitoxin system PemK/MazF family toxin [Candidatus Nomurabacteria bacterium]
MIKHFFEWIKLKEKIHNDESVERLLKEGEVWWCALGENVGIEVNGKSEFFSRPVLIYRKLSRDGFMGIPLTTQKKVGSWYVRFEFQGKTSYANLAQARVISSKRLYNLVGEIDGEDYKRIRAGFRRLY